MIELVNLTQVWSGVGEKIVLVIQPLQSTTTKSENQQRAADMLVHL